ncbi:MAG: IPT/TIG domain-containing protein, partial [Prevotella sp.]|nr:IPT/TIG domain-containing protein [Candidatus Prevotella equi]
MTTKYFKKNILRFALIAISALAAGFLQSCSNEDPFFAASEDDSPRILNTDLQSVDLSGKKELLRIDSISRAENFNYGVLATPRAYTNINWYVDDKLVFTGDTINMPFLAGTYKIKIEAVTTKGKSTYRERLLLVTPLDGDPTLANDEKSRWLNPGATVTINGNNLDNVSNLLIGGVEVENFINNGTSVTFTVPASLALGSPQMTAITKDGEKFGLDRANVTNEQYVDPGVQEIKLWEGSQVINWGDANVNISAD